MKKLYSALCALAAAATAVAQTSTTDYDFTVCVWVDADVAGMCYVTDSNGVSHDLTAGDNVFTGSYHKTTYSDGSGYGYFDSFYFYIKDEYRESYSVTACDVANNGSTDAYGYSSMFPATGFSLTTYLNWNGTDAAYLLTPTIANLDDLRTATATLTVDDASKMMIRCGSSGYQPTLADGPNTIKFNPSTESYWQIDPANYGQYLGGVRLNGAEVADNGYGTYYLTISHGDEIVVTATQVEKKCNVAFSFANDGTRDAVTAVYPFVNYSRGEAIADWAAGFEVDSHTQIIVCVNQNDFNISSITVNGSALSYISTENYISITTDTEIKVTAEAYGTRSINLSLNNPESVEIKVAETQYGASSELTGLIEGAQTLDLSEKMQYLIVNPRPGGIVDRVAYKAADGDAAETEVEALYGGYYVPLSDGVDVTVESHMKVRNATVSLFIKDTSLLYSLYVKYSDGNDIINTYGGRQPVTGWQTFNIDPETDNPVNLYFSQTDYSAPSFVLVNHEKAEPKYTGSNQYELSLKDGDVVGVYPNSDYETSAIETIGTDAAAGAEMHDLMGRKVSGNGHVAPGIYIVGGKKVIVK